MSDFSTWYDALKKPSMDACTIGDRDDLDDPVPAHRGGRRRDGATRSSEGSCRGWCFVPLALNLASNIAFTPIQFGLRNLPLAAVDVMVVLVTIGWWIVLVWKPGSQWIALVLSPYLVWVAIASALQITITLSNR